MDKVKVYVVAGANQGKTTIAHIIQEALKSHEFQRVSLQDSKPPVVPNPLPIEQRVQATKERPVHIEVVPVAPNPVRANTVPTILARSWLQAMKNARVQLSTLGTETDAVHQAHLKELDEVIEELQMLTR